MSLEQALKAIPENYRALSFYRCRDGSITFTAYRDNYTKGEARFKGSGKTAEEAVSAAIENFIDDAFREIEANGKRKELYF